jgi:hypothetical protein
MADATPPGQMQSSTDRNKNSTVQSKFIIHGHVLNNVNSAKYLGLNIHKTLRLDVHINEVTRKAHNTLSFSNRRANNSLSGTGLSGSDSTLCLFHDTVN